MKRLIWLGITLALLLSVIRTTTALAHNQVQPPQDYYDNTFLNYGSRLCLQPEHETPTNGLAIVQQRCKENDRYQRWFFSVKRLDYQKPGIYWVVNSGSGQCLDDRDGRTADGSPVQQWTCNFTSTHDAMETGKPRIQPGIASLSAVGAIHQCAQRKMPRRSRRVVSARCASSDLPLHEHGDGRGRPRQPRASFSNGRAWHSGPRGLRNRRNGEQLTIETKNQQHIARCAVSDTDVSRGHK